MVIVDPILHSNMASIEAPLTTVAELLDDLNLDVHGALARTTLGALSLSLEESRPALLKSLQQAGVAKLTDRQSIANAMSKVRDGASNSRSAHRAISSTAMAPICL